MPKWALVFRIQVDNDSDSLGIEGFRRDDNFKIITSGCDDMKYEPSELPASESPV